MQKQISYTTIEKCEIYLYLTLDVLRQTKRNMHLLKLRALVMNNEHDCQYETKNPKIVFGEDVSVRLSWCKFFNF